MAATGSSRLTGGDAGDVGDPGDTAIVSLEVSTPRGAALVGVAVPLCRPVLVVALGHGAGGSVDAPDLVTLRNRLVDFGVVVLLVTQPYRVAGRRAPAPAAHLDEAWSAAITGALSSGAVRPLTPSLPLVVAGRSSGARVAARTARALGAVAVVALAFPTHPPGRPERSRTGELATGLPTLVVNGDRDPFGVPPVAPGRTVLRLAGEDHALRRRPADVADAVLAWLRDGGWLGNRTGTEGRGTPED